MDNRGALNSDHGHGASMPSCMYVYSTIRMYPVTRDNDPSPSNRDNSAIVRLILSPLGRVPGRNQLAKDRLMQQSGGAVLIIKDNKNTGVAVGQPLACLLERAACIVQQSIFPLLTGSLRACMPVPLPIAVPVPVCIPSKGSRFAT